MYGHVSHPAVIVSSIRMVARSALEIVSISVCFMRFKRGRDVGTRRARIGVIVHVNPHVYRAGIHRAVGRPDCGHPSINQSNRSCGIENRERFQHFQMISKSDISCLYTSEILVGMDIA